MTDEKPNVPKLRFPGFTDPWEQRRLGELYEKNSERNSCGFGADRTLSVATMTFNEGGNGADESSLPGYKVIRIGDVAFEGHANKEFAYGRFVVNDLADGIMSPRFSCLRPTHDYPVSFWKYCLHNERMMRDVLIRATKKGTMMNELVFDELFGQSIPVPSEPEQRAIGTLFRDLDSLITLHQRELMASVDGMRRNDWASSLSNRLYYRGDRGTAFAVDPMSAACHDVRNPLSVQAAIG